MNTLAYCTPKSVAKKKVFFIYSLGGKNNFFCYPCVGGLDVIDKIKLMGGTRQLIGTHGEAIDI
jgi:hypothetical protein